MNSLIDRSTIAPHSIFCVGKNYLDHAREMAQMEGEKKTLQEASSPDEPVIFMKPGTALEISGRTGIPSFAGRPVSASLHYEVELVLLIDRDATEIDEKDAERFICGYGVGLDMTLRDVQLEAKKEGNPWLKSKGFRHSALISDFVPREAVKEWNELDISLLLNGREVQRSSVSRMIFPPSRLVHYLSYLYGLRKGDLIFTGTPAGVGSVETGDTLEASLDCHQENGSLSAGIARLKALIM